jgi:hypothetical protein
MVGGKGGGGGQRPKRISGGIAVARTWMNLEPSWSCPWITSWRSGQTGMTAPERMKDSPVRFPMGHDLRWSGG